MNEKTAPCGYRCGFLPGCAPLAAPFVPKQQSASPRYEAAEALARGTLFPGLDLPFMNMVNTPEGLNTPLAELMAIDFIRDEMKLYLDTHSDDSEAFGIYRDFLRLSEEAHKRYADRFGAITQQDMLSADRFSWLCSPWPWEYKEGGADR